MGVKAGGDQHELGLKLPTNGIDHFFKERHNGGISPAGAERQVDGIALAAALAGFFGGPRAGVVRVLMGRYVQHARVIVETVLGAVAVVQVPVHHQNPAQPKAFPQILRPNRNAVEEAKTHGPVAFGMMAGRSHQGKAVVHLALHDRIQNGQQTAGGEQGRLIRLCGHASIRIKGRGFETGGGGDLANQTGVVDQSDLLMRRPSGLKPFQPVALIGREATE